LLQQFWAPLLVVSVVYLAVVIVTFPGADNFIVRTFIGLLRVAPLACVFLGFSTWGRSSMVGKAASISLLVVMAGYGILAATKLSTLLSILSAIGGLYLEPKFRRIAIVFMALAGGWYFAFLSPTVGTMRANWQYSESNTLEERWNLFWSLSPDDAGARRQTTDQQLLRFSHAPF